MSSPLCLLRPHVFTWGHFTFWVFCTLHFILLNSADAIFNKVLKMASVSFMLQNKLTVRFIIYSFIYSNFF